MSSTEPRSQCSISGHDINNLQAQKLALDRQCSHHREEALDHTRLLLKLQQSHVSWVNQQQQGYQQLQDRAERLKHRLSEVKNEWRQRETANLATEARLTKLKIDHGCLQEDLVLRPELEAVQQSQRRCSEYLQRLGKLFLLEVTCGLCIIFAWLFWMQI